MTVKQTNKKNHAQSPSSLNPFRTKQGSGCRDTPPPHTHTHIRAGGILTPRSSRLSSTRWSQCCQELCREAVVSGHSFPFPPEWNITGEKHMFFFQLPSRASGGTADSQLTHLSSPCKLRRERPLLRWLKEPRGTGTQTKASFRSEVTEAVCSLWGALHALQVGHSVNPVL